MLLEILASQTSYLSSRNRKLGKKNGAVLLLLNSNIIRFGTTTVNEGSNIRQRDNSGIVSSPETPANVAHRNPPRYAGKFSGFRRTFQGRQEFLVVAPYQRWTRNRDGRRPSLTKVLPRRGDVLLWEA